MEELLKELFYKHFKERPQSVTPLKAHASNRKLFRLTSNDCKAIGVFCDDARENRAFIGFTRHFLKHSLPVPEIYGEQLDKKVYLLQDLGDTSLFDYLKSKRTGAAFPSEVATYFEEALRVLARFQIEAGPKLDYSLCHQSREFDSAAMLGDMHYFREQFLKKVGIKISDEELEEDFKLLAKFLAEADRNFFMYRDFQSRNIMVNDNELFFIDYQSGRKGALQYDVASLLYQAKAMIPALERERLLESYLREVSHYKVDRANFLKYFAGFIYLRVMQVFGAYGKLGLKEGKPLFAESIPYAINTLRELLENEAIPIETPTLIRAFGEVLKFKL